jgi:phage repressor protein C with HTH and peptisase S24 domain
MGFIAWMYSTLKPALDRAALLPVISLKLFEPSNTRLSRHDPYSATDQLHVKVITVNGDSMDGTISPGDQIFVDTGVTHFDGDGVYVFVFGKTLHVKRLQMQRDRLAVISDNPIYEKWYVEPEDEDAFYVMAKVLLRQSIDYKRFA